LFEEIKKILDGFSMRKINESKNFHLSRFIIIILIVNYLLIFNKTDKEKIIIDHVAGQRGYFKNKMADDKNITVSDFVWCRKYF
jgi:hypothetical protein